MEDQKELVVGGYRFDRLSDAGEAALEIEKATYFEQRISGLSLIHISEPTRPY